MKRAEIISTLAELGGWLRNLTAVELDTICQCAAAENGWFTPDNVKFALDGISQWLTQEKLVAWADRYPWSHTPQSVGVAMAGNIPLVGFHDLLCILCAGHQAVVKPSSQDSFLVRHLIDRLIQIRPEIQNRIQLAENLKRVDAVIATGSDNTARTFEYYFRNVPHIIRKNRVSAGILMGEEPAEELAKLGMDVFCYFGLGCRNVSRILVPEGYNPDPLFRAWGKYKDIINHHKYANNYDYQKSILLVNQAPFMDTGFVLAISSSAWVSPIACVHFGYYTTQEDLHQQMDKQPEKLQCVVSAGGWYAGSVPFGKAQLPEIDDYSDNVDTMAFLSGLS